MDRNITFTPSQAYGNGHAQRSEPELFLPSQVPTYVQPQYLPRGRKSLPGISIRAFLLGTAFGLCLLSATQLAYFGYGLWRIPLFVAVLALFHYLEFDMTARFNNPDAQVSSFLLFNNGPAYTIAHTSAMLETIVRHFLASSYKPDWLSLPFGVSIPEVFPSLPAAYPVALGLLLIFTGQLMRSLAMAHAKTNFNHIVQSTRKADHVLVTDGVYALLRHPSYFGFFWWGLGTQLVLGNRLCFLAYAVLLWNFFNRRIMHEEKHLTAFFGDDYLKYREKVHVWIPFIS